MSRDTRNHPGHRHLHHPADSGSHRFYLNDAMTDKQQPEALRLAHIFDHPIPPDWPDMVAAAAELRRLHAENESLRAERERNLHSIRVNNEIINKKLDEDETLRTGYAAARLEIESLRARSVAPAGEYPALPEPLEIDWPELHSHALGCGVEDRGLHNRYECAEYGWQDGVDKCAERVPDQIFDADQMRAYGEACWKSGYKHGAWADTKPAGAQQPGAAYAVYAELPDERAAFEARFPVPGGVSWNGSEYVVKDVYLNPCRCDRFVGQWAAWQARASHGQAPAAPPECKTEAERTAFAFGWFKALEQQLGKAPAQPAPAAQQAARGWQLVPTEVTDDMLAAFANCASPDLDWHGATESERQEVRDSFGPAYLAMLAAAPTTKPAPQPSPASQGDENA